jgi:mono/diheme cytochrome c family protein
VQKHLVILNGVAIAIFVIEDESVSGWKFTLPILIAVAGFIAMPQEKAQTVTGNTVLKASDLSGAEMYRTFCASCHGIDGKGSGPAAGALKKAPPDLTQLAKHNNGHLPDFRILRIIDGYEIRAVHGSRDMPIWGDYFRMKQRDEGIVAVREHNLVEYLRSIQQR